MKKQFFLGKERSSQLLFTRAMMIIPVFLGACSSSNISPQANHPAESPVGSDIMEGPGLFSGDKGAFYVVGGKDKATASKSVSSLSAKETSKIIDQKLEQLKQDQIELEALKKQLNNKVQY